MSDEIIIDETRLARVQTLAKGSHRAPNGEFAACVMEAVAWVSGEAWSDHPACACPVITTFMVSWNDGLPSDAERNRLLLPLIPKIVGTRGSRALENRRATMAADWLVRTHTPAWLRLAGLTADADALANLPEITNFAKTPSIMGPLEAARKNAAVAGGAAWAAAGAAARAAARAVVWAVVWDAAWAVVWDAAWDAAGGAAGGAAWAAARAALKPTQEALQLSAVALVERMCALTDADL